MFDQQTYSFNYPVNLLKKTIKRHWLLSFPCIAFVLVAWSYILIYGILANKPFFTGLGCGSLLVYIIILIRNYQCYKTYILYTYSRLATDITITEQGYTGISQGSYPWHDMKFLDCYPDCWLLYLKKGSYLIIPTIALPPEALEQIKNYAQAAGCKIKYNK